jgi:hypothetical protein
MIRHPISHPNDLMKPDLLSEILLVGTELILFVPLLLILVAGLMPSLSLR